ncbi:site-specific integrase [Mycolicibacterium brumae]|uniref:site-specific integrase n=1 Tax=Mycolicibacterium brumae TaxID=85968 RepID=UPI002D21BD84|nr:site-specific integrase [Mycolicibacterium brumae]
MTPSPGYVVQRVVMPFGDLESWTVVGADACTVEPVEAFLAHLHAVERSVNTVRAYAHDLRDWFAFCARAGLVWSNVRLEDVGRFVAWLRLGPESRDVASEHPADARVGSATTLGTSRLSGPSLSQATNRPTSSRRTFDHTRPARAQNANQSRRSWAYARTVLTERSTACR